VKESGEEEEGGFSHPHLSNSAGERSRPAAFAEQIEEKREGEKGLGVCWSSQGKGRGCLVLRHQGKKKRGVE